MVSPSHETSASVHIHGRDDPPHRGDARLRRPMARRVFQEGRGSTHPRRGNGDARAAPYSEDTCSRGDSVWTYRFPISDKELASVSFSQLTDTAQQAAALMGKAA